jgi:PAS domain S-box-containing protein
MSPVPIPPDEVGRLLSLASYALLDTPPEVDFDDLTRLASQICQTPISLITLVDKDRQWFKSHTGTDLGETSRDISFCAHAIMGRDAFVIDDARKDPRFAQNPLVTGTPKVRFYAGAPLMMPDGHALGTLCVIDSLPRSLCPDQIAALESLSRQVVSQMRLRKSGRSLAVAEQYQRSTIDAIDACVCTLDEHGRVLSTNRAWRSWDDGAGFLEQCAVGEGYLDVADRTLIPESPFAAAVSAGLKAVLAGTSDGLIQEFRIESAGPERWVQVKASRFDAGGRNRLVVVHEDVTERRQAVAFQVERRSLQNAVTAMEQVLGVVGHELRTPLAGLRAMTEYVLDPAARAAGDRLPFLRSIGDEVIRMSDTVDTLLEAARLNSGKAKWTWSSIDLQTICDNVLAQIAPLNPGRDVTLEAVVDPETGAIQGDAAAIHRLLSNLVGNAWKHTSAGTIRITVRPVNLSGNRGVELAVTDTGAGIEPAILARLGQAFALNSGVVGDHFVSGTGLGMAICMGIAAAHGGIIRVDSTLGAGTAVTVVIRADLDGPETDATDSLFAGPNPSLRAA